MTSLPNRLAPGARMLKRLALSLLAAVAALAASPAAHAQVNCGDTINANVTLLPGTYTARAQVGAELLTATFNIAAGEARDIMLGN